MKIDYYWHSVNKNWKKQVKESPHLTATEKQELVNKAHKQVAIENVKEIAIAIVKFIGIMILGFLFAWLTGAF